MDGVGDPAKNKRLGTLYENIFVCEALKRNLQPHVPVGDYLPHDLIVYTEAGNCVKVQVKGTSCRHPHQPGGRFKIQCMTGANKAKIETSYADIMACYVAPWDYWYLIPVDKLRGSNVWIYPANKDSKGQYEKYRNDWSVFNY